MQESFAVSSAIKLHVFWFVYGLPNPFLRHKKANTMKYPDIILSVIPQTRSTKQKQAVSQSDPVKTLDLYHVIGSLYPVVNNPWFYILLLDFLTYIASIVIDHISNGVQDMINHPS